MPSDDKKRARLNGIKQILSREPYRRTERPRPELPGRSDNHRYTDKLDSGRVRMVPELY